MSRLTAGLMAIFNLVVSGTVFAQDAHWALNASFGLSTVVEDGRYPVVAFVPTTFLLFDIDQEGTDLGDGNEYRAVTTQDGVRLLMLYSRISTTTTEALGSFSVVFNKAVHICEKTGCNREDDNEVLRIREGEVFRSQDHNGQIKLTGSRPGDQTISGVISIKQLTDWNRRGIVTLTDVRQPRLSVVRENGNFFNLECDDINQRNQEPQTVSRKKISKVDRTINDV